ncbi:multidrug DMT transporter permease [Amylibacter marinus]|uniref:Multidrug DMT transporter permease n=1 Tax=Amylibacter marinus TaxID=1475483 RepID=A0ABQ5VTY7_9RHOB|nr:DMT family transporter [Amylibacter marinus]GLQ34637.1 multidrug DMT transporter permease [Amylibacter marinus]
MNSKLWLFAPLILLGAVWGATIPLTKIALETGHSAPVMIFWFQVMTALVAFLLFLPRRRRVKITRKRFALFLWIAGFGSLLPAVFSITAMHHLPAGVVAITIALVPIFIMPIAILTGQEIPNVVRLSGILLGASAIFLLIGPEAALPAGSSKYYVLIALVAPLCYAIEDNFIAHFGLDGLTTHETLLGASVCGIIALSVYFWMFGGFAPIWQGGLDRSDLAILAAGTLHAFAYGGYIWMIGRAGPVFAGLVAYLVTIFGVIWSLWLLGEIYTGYIWAALACMLGALALVHPKGDNTAHAQQTP